MRLDFSKSSFSTSDLLNILPLTGWLYLIFLLLGFLLIQKFTDLRESYFFSLLFISVVTALFPLVQFPSINHWNSFNHSAGAKYIVNRGHLPSDSTYPAMYPGAFILLAVLSEVLGTSILEANLSLALLLNIFVSIVLLLMGQLLIGRRKAWLVPMSYFAFSFKYYLNNHYSPHLLGLCIFFVIIYIVFKIFYIKSWNLKIMLFVLLFSLTMTHVFSTFFAFAILITIYFIGTQSFLRKHFKYKHFLTKYFILFLVILFLGWHMYVSYEPLKVTIKSIFKTNRLIYVPSVLYNPIHGSLIPILQVLRYLTYGILFSLSAYCLIKQWKKIEVKLTFIIALGILFGSFAILFSPATYGFERFLFYAGCMVAILSSYVFIVPTIGRTKKLINYIQPIIPILVISTFIISNLYGSTYLYYMHPDEINATIFVANTASNKTVSVIIDESVLIKYFDLDNKLQIISVDDRDPYDVAIAKFAQTDLSLQYLPRQSFYYNCGFIENQRNLIYSNGLTQINALY
ncbi:MAG: hypothetical protein QXJ94_00770 [Candidatus Bathyarchaeia archaeon]